MFQFPNDPQPGDSYKSGAGYYVYDGQVWRKVAVEPEVFVELTGDTMSGALVLPASPPATPYTAAHKDYVDVAIAAASLYQGVWSVAANTPDLDPTVATPQHSYSWIATCANPLIAEMAPATLPGIGGQMIAEADNVIWNGNTLAYELVRTPGSVTGFLPLTGGTVTGDLAVEGATALANLAVGDLMTADPSLNVVAAKNLRAVGDGLVGQLWLSAGDTTRTGNLEWRMQDGARQAYMGWGTKSNWINFKTEDNCKGLYMDGGADLYMGDNSGIHWGNTSAKTDVNDFSEGICLYGYGSTSQFGLNITSGTLNISVQAASNKIDCNVAGTTQFRVSSGTSNMYSNFHCAGSITSGVTQGNTALQLSDGVKIDFSSGCQIRKVYGSNQFQFHTNASQVFAFHISNTGDVFVIDTVGSTGNSVSVTAPEALATAKALAVEPDKERGVDIMKVMAALLAKVNRLEAEMATLKGAR